MWYICVCRRPKEGEPNYHVIILSSSTFIIQYRNLMDNPLALFLLVCKNIAVCVFVLVYVYTNRSYTCSIRCYIHWYYTYEHNVHARTRIYFWTKNIVYLCSICVCSVVWCNFSRLHTRLVLNGVRWGEVFGVLGVAFCWTAAMECVSVCVVCWVWWFRYMRSNVSSNR